MNGQISLFDKKTNLEMLQSAVSANKIVVYCIVGDRERYVTEQDIDRLMTLREIGCFPYVMIYDKQSLKRGHELKALQKWVNNRIIWATTPTFDDYMKGRKYGSEN